MDVNVVMVIRSGQIHGCGRFHNLINLRMTRLGNGKFRNNCELFVSQQHNEVYVAAKLENLRTG